MRKHMIHPSLYAYEFMELTPYKTYVYALQRDDRSISLIPSAVPPLWIL